MNLTIHPHLRTPIFVFASLLPLMSAAIPQTQPGGSDLTAKVDKVFAQFDKPESPGCALAVIKDGQIIYKRGYGMADLDHDIPIKPDTPFHVASVSKQFAAFAILLLAQQGKLSLDDKVQKHITELREFDQPITIRHLLHHTSGLRDQWNLLIMSGWRLGEDVVRDDDILYLVSRMKELNFKPGDQHMYCNTGYTLLAYIVKRVRGQSLREFADANIFKPLGMTRTIFRDDHAIVVKQQAYAYNSGPNNTFKLSVPNYDTVGASSLVTTVADVYLASALGPEPPKPSPITAAVTLTEQELKNKVGEYWDAKAEEIGRISLNDGKLQLSAPGLNAALVPVQANRFRAAEPPVEVVFEAAPEGNPLRMTLNIPGRKPISMDAMPPADTSKLSEYEGDYYSEEIDSTYRVALKDGNLVVTRKKFGPTQLNPRFRDAFGSVSILGVFRFTRDAQNRVNGFRLSAGRVRNFLFVKQPR